MSITGCGSRIQSIVGDGSSGILSNFGTSTIIIKTGLTGTGATGSTGSTGATGPTGSGSNIAISNSNLSSALRVLFTNVASGSNASILNTHSTTLAFTPNTSTLAVTNIICG